MSKLLTVNRIMYLFGFLLLCLTILLNFTTKLSFISFIPFIKWICIIINCICATCCIILFIKPGNNRLEYTIFFVEAGLTTHIGFIGIGTLLLAAGCINIFINGDFKTHYKKKIIIIITYWSLITLSLYFSFSIKVFLFEILLVLFYCGLILCIYKKLAAKLSYLLPDKEIITTDINLPPKGSIIKLSDYGLSERQIAFIISSIKNGETYKTIANRHCVSLSVVKKDMAAACKQFGVTNREALRILLLRYQINA